MKLGITSNAAGMERVCSSHIQHIISKVQRFSLLLVCLLFSPGYAQSQDLQPMQAGNYWTYQEIYKGGTYHINSTVGPAMGTVSSTTQLNHIYHEPGAPIPAVGVFLFSKNSNSDIYLHSGLGSQSCVADPPILYFPKQLINGQTYGGSFSSSCYGIPATFTMQTTILSTADSVTVPAGNFSAVHFIETWTATLGDSAVASLADLVGVSRTQSGQYERWFVRGIGEVKRISTMTDGYKRQLELLASNLVPGSEQNIINSGAPALVCPVSGTDPAQGRSFSQEQDYAGAGSQPLDFKRQYLSTGSLGTSSLGPQWRHTYSRSLEWADGTGTRGLAIRGDGRGIYFKPQPGATSPTTPWVAELPQVRDTLLPVLDATGALTAIQYRNTADDSVETYDSTGKLLSIKARNGQTTTLTYTTTGTTLLTSIKNAFGRELKLVYDAQNRLTQLLPPGAIQDTGAGLATSPIRYNYAEAASLGAGVAAQNQLTSVTWQDGKVKRYHYEDARRPTLLTGITDEAGVKILTYGYDAQGRVTSTQKAGVVDPITLSYGSGATANQTTVTDNTGANASLTSRTYTFGVMGGGTSNTNGILYPQTVSAPCSQCGSTAASSTYTAVGNLTKQIAHDGTVIFFAYDAKGRQTEKATFPASYQSSATRPALNLATAVISTQWHATYNLPTKTAEPTKLTAYTYDAQGNLTGKGETQTSDTTGAKAYTATQAANTPIKSTGWSYSATSQLPLTIVETEKAYGTTTTVQTGSWVYAYDSAGNVTSVKDVLIPSNPTGNFTTTNSQGNVTQGVDDSGVAFKMTYGPRGELRSYAYGATYSIAYSYTPEGDFSEAIATDGGRVKYEYDANRRLTKITDNGVLLYAQAQPIPTPQPTPTGQPIWPIPPAASPAANDPFFNSPRAVLGGLAAMCVRNMGALALALTPSSISACQDRDGPLSCIKDCSDAIRAIYDAMNELDKRISDLLKDRCKQYTLAYNAPNPSLPVGCNTTSWQGHIRAALNTQNRIVNAVNIAKSKNCPIPPRANHLMTRELPAKPRGWTP
jgi:YD repeat-containing protein